MSVFLAAAINHKCAFGFQRLNEELVRCEKQIKRMLKRDCKTSR